MPNPSSNGHPAPPVQMGPIGLVVTLAICATIAAIVWAIAWATVEHRAIAASERRACWELSDGTAISLITCGAQTDMHGRAGQQ
jgi:ferric-dicitrate binding protein FerR (iron transport regulator)